MIQIFTNINLSCKHFCISIYFSLSLARSLYSCESSFIKSIQYLQNSWANAIVKRENLKLSQSPIYFKQTIQFIFGNPFENPDGEQRADSRETDISARSWTWALPDTLELPAAPNATVTTVEFMHHKCIPPFKRFSSKHKRRRHKTNDKLSWVSTPLWVPI